MDHYPGSAIVAEAAKAIEAKRSVALIINGLSEPVTITGIRAEKACAYCDDGLAYWLVRLDALVGYRSWVPPKE